MVQHKPLSRNETGFTIPELIIVIMVSLVLLSIAVPAVNSIMDHYRVVLTAQTISSQLQFARMKSVASNESFRVNFPAGQRLYRVEDSSGNVIAGPFYLPKGVDWNSVDSGSGITFQGNYVSFTPTGNIPTSGNGSAGRAKIINQSQVRVDIVVSSGGVIRQTPAYKTATAPF